MKSQINIYKKGGLHMYNNIVQLISSVGFPIVVCGAMAYYINTTHKELLNSFNEMIETIKKNNDIISLLKDLLKGDE